MDDKPRYAQAATEISRGMLARYMIVSLALCFAMLGEKAIYDADPPAPINPEVIDDFCMDHLVLQVSEPPLSAFAEEDRAYEYWERLSGSGTKLKVYTSPDQFEDVKLKLQRRSTVSIKELTLGDPNSEQKIWGGGFTRDGLPITIETNAGLKYVIDTPNLSPRMIDALIKAGELKKEDVIRAPFKFDGGDIVTGNKRLYVSDDFFARNANMDPNTLKMKIQQYLGIAPGRIVTVLKPPSQGSFHADALVRPLPNGKVVVSTPGPNMDPNDAVALLTNVLIVRNALGGDPNDVIQIPTPGPNALESYANSVITDTRVLIPYFHDHEAENQNAKAAYEAALPGHTVAFVQGGDCLEVGGGPHCRAGSIKFREQRVNSAGANNSPTITFDAVSGVLSMTTEPISLLAGDLGFSQDMTAPEWVSDPLLAGDVVLQLSDMQLDTTRIECQREAHFVGGTVEIIAGSNTVLQASVPALGIQSPVSDGRLDISGVVEDLVIDNSIGSAFLDAIIARVFESSSPYVFYMLSSLDLLDQSQEFTQSFTLELDGAGLAFAKNGPFTDVLAPSGGRPDPPFRRPASSPFSEPQRWEDGICSH